MQSGVAVKEKQQEVCCIRNAMGNDRHRQFALKLQVQSSQDDSIDKIFTHFVIPCMK
jgi:hypothetical protein